MKPIYEDVRVNTNKSFSIKREILPFIHTPLHFHEEYEWVLNLKGYGKRFVGDCIANFEANDLVFMGGYLPHFWKNTKEHYDGQMDNVDIIVIHFKKEAFGNDFFYLPEMKGILELLNQSRRGISISGKSGILISEKIRSMVNEKNVRQFITLMEILKIASENPQDWEILSASEYDTVLPSKGDTRLQNVFQYVSENYQKNITLSEIAEVAKMNKMAFSRYFKKTINKGFIAYLNEIRINYAKKLLVSTNSPIKVIGYDCGFGSTSYFIRVFKKKLGQTPIEYRVSNSIGSNLKKV